MYAFIIQLVDFLRHGTIHYYLVFFVLVWLRWFLVSLKAKAYTPFPKTTRATAGVIIPVMDEPVEIFTEVLRRIQKQRPQEIVVVINGPRNHNLEAICRNFKNIKMIWSKKAGKRYAIQTGLKHIKSDITVLVDSDTFWEPHMLRELKKPFADPTIGGVTTLQKIWRPDRSILIRFCDWLEVIRAEGSLRAMSTTGKVGCLPGRTIAFRTHILRESMDAFLYDPFMGFHKEVSDDRCLTNLTLRAGYKTVLQSTAVVYTDAPTSWRKFIRQQLRWAEGSQYNNIRMTPWMLRHAPFMLFLYWTDILIPFMLMGAYTSFALSLIIGKTNTIDLLFVHSFFQLVVALILGSYLSVALRNARQLSTNPANLLYLFIYIPVLTFIMAPIRIIGFARMADNLGWGTRSTKQQSTPRMRLRHA